MTRRRKPVEGQTTLFDPYADERDEPAAGLDRSTSDDHPEHELDEQNPTWRVSTLRRVELPAIVEVTSVETGKPRGRFRGDAMLAVVEALVQACDGRRGVAVSIPELAALARLSPSHAERVVLALESLFLVEVHRRERRHGRQRQPHTYALAWGNLRELVPPTRTSGEPPRYRPLVAHETGADVPSHEGTRPLVTSPRGATPTSSLKDVCKDHVHGLRKCSGEGDWLGNVEPADLRNGEWLDATFRRAIAAGIVPDDGPSRVFVFAAACHAVRKANVPGAMFRRIVVNGERGWPTDEDTEQARGMIRRREPAATSATTAVLAGIGRPVPTPDVRPTSTEFELKKTWHSLRLAERFPEGASRG